MALTEKVTRINSLNYLLVVFAGINREDSIWLFQSVCDGVTSYLCLKL